MKALPTEFLFNLLINECSYCVLNEHMDRTIWPILRTFRP